MLGQKLPLSSQREYSTGTLGKQQLGQVSTVGGRPLADIDERSLWAIANSADAEVEASLLLAVEGELEKREAHRVRRYLS